MKAFLDDHIPHRGELVGVWQESLSGLPAEPLTLPSDHYRVLGSLFDVLVATDLSPHPPLDGVLGYLVDADLDRALAGLGYRRSPQAPQGWERDMPGLPITDTQLESLHLLARLHLAVDLQFSSPNRTRDQKLALTTAIEESPLGPSLETDARELHEGLTALWKTHLTYGRVCLSELGELVAIQPVFAPGFGVGDLVIGSTLVEVKAHSKPAVELAEILDQLLFYLLLDHQDRYRIDRLAVYLGWQGGMLCVDAMTLFKEPSHTLVQLRRQFRGEFRDVIDLHRRRHQTNSS